MARPHDLSDRSDPLAIAAGGGQAPDVRLLNRLSIAFLLDAISIVRGDRHLLDSLLLSTITQANTAPISGQADLQVAYAGADEVPPDSLRRPISINALASSLQLPFETVRRRVGGMVRKGWCEMAGGGVIVPARILTDPEYFRNGVAVYQRLQAFYYQLKDLGLLGELPPPTVDLGSHPFPLRLMARLATDYALRALEAAMAGVGDLADAVILLEIIRSNTEHLPVRPRAEGAGEALPDAQRTPVRASVIARRIGLPEETTRRRLVELELRGFCTRSGRGYVVGAETLSRPGVIAGLGLNLVNLQRMFASFAQLGVLKLWDEARPAA